jgi:hypothetical protein
MNSGVSEYEAVVYVLKSNIKVEKAIQMERSEGCDIASWDISAYKAAATASFTQDYQSKPTQVLPVQDSSAELTK